MESPWGKVLALSLTSFLLAGAVAWCVFDAMPHSEDEHANWFQAQVFASGHVSAAVPAGSDAFPVPFVVEWKGRRFSKYPPGYSLLLTPGMWVNQPWLVNAVAAAAGILGTFLLGRELFGETTGLWAAALGTLSPLYLLLGGTLLAHTPTLAALVFAAWALVRARRRAESRRTEFAVAAGLCLGLGVLLRPWTALACAVPFVAVAMADLRQRQNGAVGLYVRVVVATCVVAVAWPAFNWVTTGAPTTNAYTLWWTFDRLGFGSSVGPEGYAGRTAAANLAADLVGLLGTWLAWPRGPWTVLPLGLLVVGVVAPESRRRTWFLLAPVVALVLAYTAYWAGSGYLYGARYYSEGMPYLWVLAARGLTELRRRRPGRWIDVALRVGLVAGTVFSTGPELLQRRNLYGVSRDDWRALQEAGLHNALVFVRSEGWTDYAALSWANRSPPQRSDTLYALDLGCMPNAEVAAHYPARSTWYYDRYEETRLFRLQFPDCKLSPESSE